MSSLQVCRDECETLEYDLCSQELAIARAQPMINHQLVLPVCAELPVVGSTLSYNCVRLGIPHVTKLIRPHGCYVDDGAGYRGAVSGLAEVAVDGDSKMRYYWSMGVRPKVSISHLIDV